MKFFWKLFFSIVLITELFLGIGGCVLIQSVFNHSIRREIEAAWQESDLLCISLNHGLLLVPEMTFGEDVGSLEEILNELCRSIMMQTSGSAVPFSLSSPQGTLVAGRTCRKLFQCGQGSSLWMTGSYIWSWIRKRE